MDLDYLILKKNKDPIEDHSPNSLNTVGSVLSSKIVYLTLAPNTPDRDDLTEGVDCNEERPVTCLAIIYYHLVLFANLPLLG